jgi:hypothetical protein
MFLFLSSLLKNLTIDFVTISTYDELENAKKSQTQLLISTFQTRRQQYELKTHLKKIEIG